MILDMEAMRATVKALSVMEDAGSETGSAVVDVSFSAVCTRGVTFSADEFCIQVVLRQTRGHASAVRDVCVLGLQHLLWLYTLHTV